MRVLHLAPDEAAGSGIAAYGVAFRAALARAGIEAEPLVARAAVFNTVLDVTRYVSCATEAAREYDIVHVEIGAAALRQFYGALAVELRTKTPTFLTVHDPPNLAWFPLYFTGMRRHRHVAGLARRVGNGPGVALDRLALRRAAGTFALTTAGVDRLRARVNSEHADSIQLLPYPRRIATGSAQPQHRAGADLTIGFLGFWYPGKGIEDLVHVIGKLRAQGVSIRARLWGDISPTAGAHIGAAYREHVLNAIRRERVGDLISVEGFLAEDVLVQQLATCDALVLPFSAVPERGLIVYSTSAALHDAYAAGIPVVVANTRALRDTAVNDATVFYDAGDLEALARALRRLATDRPYLEQLQAAATVQAEAHDASACGAVARAAYEAALGR